MKKLKAFLLACTVAASSAIPFAQTLAVNAVDLSASYAKEVDYDLWERFLKYDLCITDYGSLTDEEKELCKFIFETERSADDTIICARARMIIAGYDVGERVMLENLSQYNDIHDYEEFYYMYLTEEMVEQYESIDELMATDYYDYNADVPILHCVPDIKHIDSEKYYNEYWIDSEGTERVFSTADSGNKFSEHYADYYGYYKYNEETQEYDYQSIDKPDIKLDKFEDDNFEYVALPDGTAAVSALLDKTVTETGVPEAVNGMTVSRIEFGSFAESAVESVSLPETVEIIAPYAFKNCTNLKNINIPTGLDYLGNEDFGSCISLGDIVIDCPNLITVYFPFYYAECDSIYVNIKEVKNPLVSWLESDITKFGERVTKIGTTFISKGYDMPSNLKLFMELTKSN